MSAQAAAGSVRRGIARFGRWLTLTALSILTIVAISWTAVVAQYYWSYDVPRAQIDLGVSYRAEPLCPEEYPVFVRVANKSARKVIAYSFSLAAKLPGKGEAQADRHTYLVERVIMPGEGYGSCWRIKKRSDLGDEWLSEPDLRITLTDFRPVFD